MRVVAVVVWGTSLRYGCSASHLPLIIFFGVGSVPSDQTKSKPFTYSKTYRRGGIPENAHY